MAMMNAAESRLTMEQLRRLPPEKLRRDAFHAAGHAAMAWMNGDEILEVALTRNVCGNVRSQSRPLEIDYWTGMRIWAGAVAEASSLGRAATANDLSTGDRHELRIYLSEHLYNLHSLRVRPRWYHHAYAQVLSTKLVRDDSRRFIGSHWGVVEVVADALIAEGTLDRERFAQIVAGMTPEQGI